MADPLLSTLCTICHINVPKYTCPRCSVQTCSLPCIRRHKLWSSCSGTRDPTVYKPRSQLATPSGIDHDYNFLHSIEHKIERSEKEIIEERGLIRREDLKASRDDNSPTGHGHPRSKPKQLPGQECIDAMLKMMGTRVHQAPKGMKRNSENGTSWSKNNRQIHWQVEWMREAGTQRQLGKLLANKSVGYYYDEWYDEDRRLRMSNDEKREDKKRKASEHKQRTAKRAKMQPGVSLTVSSQQQNPETSAWDLVLPLPPPTNVVPPFSPESYQRRHNHRLYLLRPLTSSKFPKVLAPIDPTKPLAEILRRRDVLEFPTIYVMENPTENLPEEFMLEKDYLKVTGQGGAVEAEASDSSSDDDGKQDDNDDTRSSGSDDLEDGELDD